MSDVARAAGVSVSTVSHVVNQTRPVDPGTVRAVRAAIEAVGYIPNSLARSLARSASNTVGVAISTFANHYFSDLVRGIDAACEEAGLMMLFSDTHDRPDLELQVVQSFHHRRVDGILLAPTRSGSGSSALDYLQANRIPTVLVDHVQPDAPFDQVGTDNRDAMQALVAHLIDHGHRRIGLVSGAPDNSTTDERVAGYRAALEQAGIGGDDDLVACGLSLIEPARDAAHRLLALPAPPSAIVAGNNLMTLGVLQALRDAGLAVPGDIAFAGFDDVDWADLFTPRLTVVAQPLQQIGATAARRLVARIHDPDRRPLLERLPATLRIRDSCGCPARLAERDEERRRLDR